MKPLEQYNTYSIPAADIFYDVGFNCREEFSPQSVADLAESIRQHGLQYPVTVQPIADAADVPPGCPYKWRLIEGHRRYRAMADILQWLEIPATIRSGLTGREAFFLNFTENLECRDLNPLEEALAIQRLFPNGGSDRQIAKELKRDKRWVSQRVKILKLPPKLQRQVAQRILSLLDVEHLAKFSDPKQQLSVAQSIVAARRGKGGKRFRRRAIREFRPRKTKGQMRKMIAWLLSHDAPQIAAKALAWATGYIDDSEFKDFALGKSEDICNQSPSAPA
jgi:ParB/RepB/Spo0J family partition protein